MKFTYSRVKMTVLAQVLVTVFVLMGGLAPLTSHALSCLAPSDFIPMQLSSSSEGIVFTGTITEVVEVSPKNTIVTVAVTTAHKGVVPATVDIEYEYMDDWGYGCTSGPGQVGETKTFFTGPSAGPTVTAGLSLTADDSFYDIFLSEMETQNPTSSIEEATPRVTITEPAAGITQLLAKIVSELEQIWAALLRIMTP